MMSDLGAAGMRLLASQTPNVWGLWLPWNQYGLDFEPNPDCISSPRSKFSNMQAKHLTETRFSDFALSLALLKGLEDLGVKPTAMEAILPDYLWRFRPSGQYAAIKESAKKLRDT